MDSTINPYAAPAEVGGDDWDRSRTKNLEPLRNCGAGLYFVAVALYLFVTSVIANTLVSTILTRFAGPSTVALPMNAIAVLTLASYVCLFVGMLFCAAVPPESNARQLAKITCLALLMNIAVFFLSYGASVLSSFAFSWIIFIVRSSSALFNLVGFITFLMFLRRINFYIERKDLASRVSNISILLAISLVCGSGVVIGIRTSNLNNPSSFNDLIILIGGGITLVCFVASFIMLGNLCRQSSKIMLFSKADHLESASHHS